MSYKTILVVIQGPEDAVRALDTAIPLAARFGSHLIGVHAAPLPVAYSAPMGFPDTDFIVAGSEANQERARELQQTFDARTAREGIAAEWRFAESFSGDSAVSALKVARACDLIVVQQANPKATSSALPNVEALLFETGRPVLFVPYAMSIDTGFDRVLVAWNGSPEAARAAFDALPFIVAARETEILCVDPRSSLDQDAAVAAADIAEALTRHGARITVSNAVSAGVAPGEAIENRLAETGAQLLVMGAFSQPWLKQFFFGGATRTLLRSMPTATLMSR